MTEQDRPTASTSTARPSRRPSRRRSAGARTDCARSSCSSPSPASSSAPPRSPTAYSQGWLTPAPPEPACQPEVVPAPARSSFVVNVLNATGKEGMAASVAKGLSQRKFSIGGISNAPETWYVTQPAVIHHGPASLDRALLVQQIPGSELFEDEGRTSKSVDVVVGLGYTAMVPLPPRFDPLPSRSR